MCRSAALEKLEVAERRSGVLRLTLITGCDTSKMCVGFPWCLRTLLAFAAATTVGVFKHKVYVQWDVPHKPYNFALDSFHTTKLCSRLSSKEVDFYTRNGHFGLLPPSLEGLQAAYDVHLNLSSLESA